MKTFEIIDEKYGSVLGIIKAKTINEAYCEANIFVAESGRDREYDYCGFDIIEITPDKKISGIF